MKKGIFLSYLIRHMALVALLMPLNSLLMAADYPSDEAIAAEVERYSLQKNRDEDTDTQSYFVPLTDLDKVPEIMNDLDFTPAQGPTLEELAETLKFEGKKYMLQVSAGVNHFNRTQDGTWRDDTFPGTVTRVVPAFGIGIVQTVDGLTKWSLMYQFNGRTKSDGLALHSDEVYWDCANDHSRCADGTLLSHWRGHGDHQQIELNRDFHFKVRGRDFVYQIGLVAYKATWHEVITPTTYRETLKINGVETEYEYPTSTAKSEMRCPSEWPVLPSFTQGIGIQRGNTTIGLHIEYAILWNKKYFCPQIGNGVIWGLRIDKRFDYGWQKKQ